MAGFDNSLSAVLKWEGGYVNDPRDPGGETKYGISKRAYPDLDIKSLTPEMAARIYRRDYWDACRCDALPPGLALLVFDAAVNQGVNAAVRMLQSAAHVAVDGKPGPQTIKAAQLSAVLPDMYEERKARYERSAGWPIYGRGWINRLNDIYRQALAMVRP